MNTEMISNTEYNMDFTQSIVERIRQSVIKIKNFIKPEKDQYRFYYKLDGEFDDIADSLEKYTILDNEFSAFLHVKNKVLNIIYNNCRDSYFGHCEFAIKLLEFFNELLIAKIKLLSDFTSKELEIYNSFYQKYEDKVRLMDKKFYLEIFKPINENFSEEKLYEMMRTCKW